MDSFDHLCCPPSRPWEGHQPWDDWPPGKVRPWDKLLPPDFPPPWVEPIPPRVIDVLPPLIEDDDYRWRRKVLPDPIDIPTFVPDPPIPCCASDCYSCNKTCCPNNHNRRRY